MKSRFLNRLLSDKVMTLLVVSIILLVVLRFVILPFSPPGFYIDEMASREHAIAMVAHLTNAQGDVWPLYSASFEGGFTTPIYLYPLSAWASLFGFSPFALRAFSQFVTIGAILLVALGLRRCLDVRAALTAAIVGLVLPWGWLQGGLAWDPVMVPLAVAVAFYGWSLLLTSTRKSTKISGSILLPSGIIMLAYVYPPYWVVAPLLFAAAYATLYIRKQLDWKQVLLTAIATLVAVVPLLLFILSPGTLGRSSSISIFHGTTLFEAITLFIGHLFLFVNPFFLFIYGDFNARQSTGYQGMLGVASLVPVAILVWLIVRRYHLKTSSLLQKNEYFLLVTGMAGFAISLVGAALTNEGQPHSLRSCAAWVFTVIIITIGWRVLFRLRKKWIKVLAISLFTIGTLAYIIDLAFFFPSRAGSSFNVDNQKPDLSSIYSHIPTKP